SALYSCVFFFFQAEDGIRDFHVTGVQTCALPILDVRHTCNVGAGRSRFDMLSANGKARSRRPGRPYSTVTVFARLRGWSTSAPRSEERRVGKECRSGVAPCQ